MSTLVQRLREHADMHESIAPCDNEQALWMHDLRTAADLIERLRGERTVFAELMNEAAGVLHTLDRESLEEGGRLQELALRLEVMPLYIRRSWENHDA